MLRSLLISTASNGSRFLVATVITLVMTPVYIHQLGNYDYGIWEILGSIVGYLGLLDLGLRPTIARFAAYFRTDSRGQQQRLFTTSVALMSGVGLIASLALIAWSLTFPGILAADDEAIGRYTAVIQLFAVHVLISFPYFALESIFEGRLWYTTKNNIAIGHKILGATFLYLYLPTYDPLVLMVVVNLTMTLSKLLILLALLHLPAYGRYRLRSRYADKSLVARMFRFGSKSLAQGIAGQISNRADPLLIGVFLGAEKIVFFHLAQTLLTRTRSLTQMLGHAFMPAFATLSAADDKAAIENYFFTGTKFVFAIRAAASAGMIALGPAFISLWIGPDYGETAQPIVWILATASVIGGSLPLHNRLLTAINRHGRLAILYSLRACLNVALTILLIPFLGLTGVALATLLAHLLLIPFTWRLVFSYIEATPIHYLRTNIVPTIAVACVMLATLGLLLHWNPVDSWLDLAIAVAFGGGLYLALFTSLCLSRAERKGCVQLATRARASVFNGR